MLYTTIQSYQSKGIDYELRVDIKSAVILPVKKEDCPAKTMVLKEKEETGAEGARVGQGKPQQKESAK